jgi:hypothetical protein
MPSSIEIPASAPRASPHHAPPVRRLLGGKSLVHDRLNSRSASRRARWSLYLVVSSVAPFTATSRPRTIG